jgi:hypothetical protein
MSVPKQQKQQDFVLGVMDIQENSQNHQIFLRYMSKCKQIAEILRTWAIHSKDPEKYRVQLSVAMKTTFTDEETKKLSNYLEKTIGRQTFFFDDLSGMPQQALEMLRQARLPTLLKKCKRVYHAGVATSDRQHAIMSVCVFVDPPSKKTV